MPLVVKNNITKLNRLVFNERYQYVIEYNIDEFCKVLKVHTGEYLVTWLCSTQNTGYIRTSFEDIIKTSTGNGRCYILKEGKKSLKDFLDGDRNFDMIKYDIKEKVFLYEKHR